MHFRIALITSLVATMLPTASLAAQEGSTARGSGVVAGSGRITWWRPTGSDDRIFEADINPRVGYFVYDGLAVNGNLQYGRRSGDSYGTTSWGVGPGLTYYFCRAGSCFHPFLTGRSLFTWSHTKWDYNDAEGESRSVYWLVGGGVVLMFVKQVGLTTEAFYQWSEHDYAPDNRPPMSSELYGLRFGVAAFLF